MSEERAPAWHVELAPELIGVLETRGWKDLEPGKAASAILKSYRELELMKGAPPEQLLKLPTKPEIEDPEAWRAIWNRLGAPAEPAGYEFGEGVSEDLAAVLREQAAALGLPASKVKELSAGIAKHLAAKEAAAASAADNSAEEQIKLKANWGKNYDANMFLAQEGAAKAGISKEAVSAMEKVLGFAGTMEHFLKLGQGTKEAGYVTGGPQNGVLSREMALARREELKRDDGWTKKYLSGGVNERKEMSALNRIISGEG